MLKPPQDPPRHMTHAPLGAETRPGSTKWLGHTAGHAPRAPGSEGSSTRPRPAPRSPQLSGLAALGSSYVTSENGYATTHVAPHCSCQRGTH